MLSKLSVAATSFDEGFREIGLDEDEANAAWVLRQIETLSGSEALDDEIADATYLLLFGVRDPVSWRLRTAQAHLRHDLTPSHWSHAALLWKMGDTPKETELLECSLTPQFGFGLPPVGNGLQTSYLGYYDDPQRVPNVALLRIPVERSTWLERSTSDEVSLLEQFVKQRSIVDMPKFMVLWLSFLWGATAEGNPLQSGIGIPAAVAVDTLLGAANYDLCPGLDNRVTCPEAFWQTARWWHPFYKFQDLPRIFGAWFVNDRANPGEIVYEVDTPWTRPPLVY